MKRTAWVSVFLCAMTSVKMTSARATDTRAQNAPLTFDQALSRLMEVSTSLQVQQTQLDSADIRQTQARFQFTPSVSLAAKTGKSGTSLYRGEQTSNQAVASSDLNLFRFGADWADLAAAGKDLEAQQALYENETLNAELQSVSFLVDEISKRINAEVDREFVKLREQSLLIAKERFSQGLLAQQEVEKVKVDLENSRARLADAEASQAEADAALMARIGTSSVDSSWPWKAELLERKSRVFKLGEKPSDLHPGLRAAALVVEAQESKLSSKRRLFWPSLDANFTYGFYDGVTQTGLPAQKAWSGALTLSFPLFNRYANASDIGLQAQSVIAAEKKRDGVRIDLDQEKRSSQAGFELALESVKRRVDTLQISKRIYQDNLRRFRGGRITADELLIDQDRLLTSQLLEVEGWATVHRQSTRYCHALGYRLRDCL